MGYTAQTLNGQMFEVTDPGRVIAYLSAYPRVSWCAETHEYLAETDDNLPLPNRYAETLNKLLADYGFICYVKKGDPTVVEIHYWGGDKLGSSWDTVWDALATGVTEPVRWVMLGEDYEAWIVELRDGKATQTPADLVAVPR